ncbi:hypothetical protein [Denitromonas ohlonensis]|jgi:hypothetical protein|uniref:Type 4a pilus biogenesis protein PilO n=2 Tax=Denitromonas TaxID=139331 RepID=A0A557R5N3_9RHOO|nr:hypothetical protein [Denitromonas ohlonensis]TVO60457.1 hypothetical protein FHP90_18560 [Denitromonas ohlonensis]TVO78622.1 hypothetical protein FHP89_05385 [Denitromonas ohlonensis]TVT75509.1 MAG: hypothetical protein FHP92_11155 [Denitromonas halophila]
MTTITSPRLDRLRERTLRAVMRAGWAGAVGVALLAFALAFGLSTGSEQAAQAESLAAERAALLKVADVSVQPVLSDRDRLAAFYTRFAPASELSSVLAKMHVAAAEHGLLPERGDYRSALVSGTPLVRVTATLPMRGSFDDLYAWLGQVLAEQPGAAVEQLSIKREQATAGQVSADVRVSVFVRGGV